MFEATRRLNRFLPHLLVSAALGMLSPLAAAQTDRSPAFANPGVAADQPAPPKVDPRLESVPLEVESLGLTIHPIRGANVTAEKFDGNLSIVISDASANPRWSLRFQALESSQSGITAEEQIDNHLAKLDASSQIYSIVDRRAVTTRSGTAQLCLISRTSSNDLAYISGWLLAPSGSRNYLAATILMMPDDLPTLKSALIAMFESMSIRTVDERSLELHAQLSAAQAVLDSITPARLKELTGQSQWFRIYKPAGTANAGEEEIGYSFIEVFEGKRGLLNPERSEFNYDAREHETGLVVRVQGRVLIDPARGEFYDSVALYWLAWDMSEEAWSIRATQRQGQASRSEAETGVRSEPTLGEPRGLITVVVADSLDRSREPVSWEAPEVYLSLALNWLLPQLLPTREPTVHTYTWAFYDFMSTQPTMAMRIDRWEPKSESTTHWLLTTRLGADAPEITSTYSRNGRLLRRTLPDGVTTEPIEPEQIRTIWKRKDLPMSSD